MNRTLVAALIAGCLTASGTAFGAGISASTSEKKAEVATSEKATATNAKDSKISQQNSSATKDDHQKRQQDALKQLEHSLGNAHGHSHEGETVPLTQEVLARQHEINGLTEAKLKALASYLRALVDGEDDEVAIQKAGVPITELDRIAFLSERYYPARASALAIEAELAALKKTPPPVDPRELNRRRVAESRLESKLIAHAKFRDQYFRQVSPETRTLVDKFEPQFVALVRDQAARRDRLKKEAREEVIRAADPQELVKKFIVYLNAKSALQGEKAAVKTSGLSEKTALGLGDFINEYAYHKLSASHAEGEMPKIQERMREKEKAGKNTAFEVRLLEEYRRRVEGLETYRKKFTAETGLKLLEAIEANFEAISEAYQRHEDGKRLQ